MDKDLAKILDQVASKYGITIFEAIADMQKVINEAWTGFDEATLKKQKELFPHGKPTPDEFIRTIANEMNEQ